MHVTRAGPEQAEAIRDLINLAFRVERFFVEGDRISLEEVRSRFESGEFLMAGGSGCVYVEGRGDRAYIGLLAVDPAKQRQGIGRQLMQAAEQRSRELGCRFVDLWIVSLRQELPAFYGALRYVETGTQSFPAEVPTKMPCHFVVFTKTL